MHHFKGIRCKMKRLVLILIIFHMVILPHVIGKTGKFRLLPGRMVPIFEFFTPCKNVSKGFQFYKLQVETIPGTNTVVLRADSLLIRKITRFTKITVSFEKCEDRNYGTCQHFTTWRFGDESCSIMEAEHQLWSKIFRKVRPELRCPINPGPYILRNGTVDVELLSRLPFPLEKYFWRVRMECYDPELVACAELGARYFRTRT